MQEAISSVRQNPEDELDDDSTRFDNSLQELKDLCSQLRYAADYCENSFVSAEKLQKKKVMQNTKEYLCTAVVTVVDHLGSVSANLDYRLSMNNAISETEIRINGLKQRLVTYQQYNHKLSLTKLSWSTDFPRYHRRYIFPPMPDLERAKEVSRKCGTPVAAENTRKHKFETEEEVPLFFYTCNHKPSLSKDSSKDIDDPSSAPVLPVHDSQSTLPKARNPSFYFEDTPKLKRNMLNWKVVQNNDLLSLIRKSKRAM